MIILPPMGGRRREPLRKVAPQKLIPALAFDLLMTGLGLYALYQTGEPVLLIVPMLVGIAPLLWVAFSAKHEHRQAQDRAIVEDARRRR